MHVQIFVAFSLVDAVLVISARLGGVSPRQMQTLALPNSDLEPRDTDPRISCFFEQLWIRITVVVRILGNVSLTPPLLGIQ